MEEIQTLRKKDIENAKNSSNREEDIEQIAIDVIKVMLEGKVPLEDIQHITGKSIEEIKKIGNLDD